MLKGAETINKIITEQLNNLGFEIEAFMDTDFYAFPSSNQIYYSLVVSERMDNLFMNFCKSLSAKLDTNIFIMSLMHEVFHIETIDELSDEEYNYSQDIKKGLTSSDEDAQIYFNLPDEYLATSRAIEYINSHSAEMRSLYEALLPAFRNFYQLNNVVNI